MDGDSNTDVLLIGAPMFMGAERDEQGQVYVYTLNQVLKMLFLLVFVSHSTVLLPVMVSPLTLVSFSHFRMASLSMSSP